MCLALPGRLVAIAGRDGLRMGTVDYGGVRKEVCLEGVPEARVEDWVLVHVGFALRVVDADAAAEALALLGGEGSAEPGATAERSGARGGGAP